MNKTYQKIALCTSVLILVFFVVFVINQTAQVVQLADKVSLTFGNFIFWTLLIIYAILILVPVLLFLKLPRSLMPPKSEDAPEFNDYLNTLKKRLAANQHTNGMDLANREQIEKALAVLAKDSDEIIRQSAATLFISTAISQAVVWMLSWCCPPSPV